MPQVYLQNAQNHLHFVNRNRFNRRRHAPEENGRGQLEIVFVAGVYVYFCARATRRRGFQNFLVNPLNEPIYLHLPPLLVNLHRKQLQILAAHWRCHLVLLFSKLGKSFPFSGSPPLRSVFDEHDSVLRIRNAPINFLVFLHPFFCVFLCHCVIHKTTASQLGFRVSGVGCGLDIHEVFGGRIGRVHLALVKKVYKDVRIRFSYYCKSFVAIEELHANNQSPDASHFCLIFSVSLDLSLPA